MSDVNISTSWSSLPSSDTEYNTVLGVAGYDTDDERLFLSAQQVPGIARNVTTEYARGFRITSGYDGIVLHDAITETPADLKTVKITMSTAGTAYDLADARCYVQFKNHYSVDIASWALQADASDTLTTIASGGTIAAGAEIQIDFKNDYNAARFILTVTYSGEISPIKLYKLTPGKPCPGTVLGYSNWSEYGGVANAGGWQSSSSNYQTCDTYVARNSAGTTFYGVLINTTTFGNPRGGACVLTVPTGTDTVGGLSDSDWYLISGNYYGFNATTFSSILLNNIPSDCVATSVDDVYNRIINAPSSGLNTADLNNYTGNMWQCRLIANVAAISPGPMATESEGGTEGDFDISSDNLDVPDLPAEGIAISPRAGDLYLMTESQFGIFQNAIYGKATDIREIFQDITNCILSVMTFPLPTSAYTTRFNSNVFAGGQDLGNSTECAVINRYIEYDCGTVDLNLFWDSALDLNPYTKLNIFIPAVGMRPIDADCCMGHTIGLKYHIDLLTGTCVAFVTVDGDVYQQHTGNIGQHMAFSGTNNGLITSGILSGLAGNAANISENSNPIAGAGNLVATTLNAFKVPRSVVGNFSGNTAQLAVQKPYIEIIRPIQQLPRDYTEYNAYPCYMTAQLVNLTGWTEIQDIFIDDVDCTQAEREKLLNLFHNGIIL